MTSLSEKQIGYLSDNTVFIIKEKRESRGTFFHVDILTQKLYIHQMTKLSTVVDGKTIVNALGRNI
jgi:hypothetical protein